MKPLILINSGEDADFAYATHFLTHDPALYIQFAEGDDALVVNILELGRAKETSSAKAVSDREWRYSRTNSASVRPSSASAPRTRVRKPAMPVVAVAIAALAVGTPG